MENKYFKVTCKCGHVGKTHFIRIDFPIIATTGKDAAACARRMPRVKHDKKDAILNCVEITADEYNLLVLINKNDPYLKCGCRQEQDVIKDFALRIEKEPTFIKIKKNNKRNSLKYKIKKSKLIDLESAKEISFYGGNEVELY